MEEERRRGLKPGGGAIGPGVHGMARNLHLSKELMQERLEMSEMGR
jgi:pantothenate kinase type III